MRLPIFRASELPRVLSCEASALLDSDGDPGSEYAALGIAGHAFMAAIAAGSSVEEALAVVPDEYRAMCRRIDLDGAFTPLHFNWEKQSEVSYHYARGELRSPEVATDPMLSVTGTADFVATNANQIAVYDWKFGSREYVTPAASNLQLRFYALCAWLAIGAPVGCQVHMSLRFINPDTGEVWIDPHNTNELELIAFQEQLARALRKRRESFEQRLTPEPVEGSWCRYCPSRYSCPAKVRVIRQFSQGLIPTYSGDMSPVKVGETWNKVRFIKRAIEEYEREVAQWVRTHGPVPLPGGKLLGMRKRQGNEVLDVDIAQPVLEKWVGVNHAATAIKRSLSKQAILDICKPIGGKTLADEVLEEIRELGGASRNKDSEFVGEI